MDCVENESVALCITEIEQCLLIYKKDVGKSKQAVAQWLKCWILNPRVLGSKPLGGSKVNTTILPSEVDSMSTRKS